MRHGLEFFHHLVDGALDTQAQRHRVHAGCQVFQALLHHAVCQHRGRGGAVAGQLAGACRHLAQQLRAHILEGVGQVHGPRHHHPGVDDLRWAKLALDDDGATARPQCYPHRFGQGRDAALQAFAGAVVVQDAWVFHGGVTLGRWRAVWLRFRKTPGGSAR